MGAERTERTERRSVIRVRVIINLGGEEINQNHRPPVCEGQQLLRMMFATSKTPLRVSTLHWNRRSPGDDGASCVCLCVCVVCVCACMSVFVRVCV